MIVQKGSPRKNAFLAEQNRRQKVRSAIKSNVPNNSTVEDKY